MPHPSVWSSVLPIVLVYSIVGPSFAGLSALFTKRFETRWFWLFTVLFAAAATWWVAWDVGPSHQFEKVFHQPPGEGVRDLDYEMDRGADAGVFVFLFRADAATVADLVQKRAMEPTAPPTVALVPEGLDVAAAWPPPWLDRARAFHGTAAGGGYRRVDCWLLHDDASGDTRFVMVGSR